MALLGCLACGFAAGGEMVLDGIDVYGTQRLTVRDAELRYGKPIREVIRLKSRDTKAAARSADELRNKIEDQIRSEWGFAWTRLSLSDYYADGTHKAFVSVDVVETKDRVARWPFKKAPSKTVADPGGLLASWANYHDLGWTLFKQGALSVAHDACLSFYCEWGAQTPELRAYEQKFATSAKEHKDGLLKVLREEREPARRATAVYLLGYLPDANEAARLIAEALDDAEVEVRGAALRVYADFAVHHKEVFLPITRLPSALDYPTADDRNKAMAVVAGMASNPIHRRFLILKTSDRILRLMQSRQPSISDTAYAAIGILTGESFDRRDHVSWERWLERAKAQEEAKPEAVQTE